MYFYLSETTLKTILGTILKNSIKNFSLYTIFSLFTTHIYVCYHFIFKHSYSRFFDFGQLFVFLGLFRICPKHKYPSFGGFADFVLFCTKCFLPNVSSSKQNYNLNKYFNVSSLPYIHRVRLVPASAC